MNIIQYFVIFDSPKAHPTITESGFGSDKSVTSLSAANLTLNFIFKFRVELKVYLTNIHTSTFGPSTFILERPL